GLLKIRQVSAPSGDCVQAVVPHIRNNPDDRMPGLIVFGRAEPYAFAERVFIGPEFSREGLVDYRYKRRVLGIRPGEVAAPDQRDAHCAKVIGTYHAVVEHGRFSNSPDRPPFYS